ncbi:MAG: ribonuclease P protein component [Ancylobacter novellus]|uniref:Ribonuclease P protein component n=1 Tax=Ancylobacter novellus TaxID=921 RepID=A0A2W5M319_ANCNO|nr:MAG: ribonuclease P protein component [Ancylobacter novellus]
MTTLAADLDMMRRRRDFVAAANKGVKIGGPVVGLQMHDREAAEDAPRVGFTVTKRVGHAVERSRMKRRLREAARAELSGNGRRGCDYVIVARRAVLDADFDRLKRELRQAVKRAHGRSPSGGADKAAPPARGERESGR